MLCKKCGANVLDGIKFCPNCGSSLEEVPVTNIDINNAQDTYTNSAINSEQNSVVTPVTSSVQNTVVEPISVPQQPINNVPPVMPVNNGNMYNNVNNVPSNGNKSNSGLGFVIGAIVVAAIVCAVIIISATMKNDEDGDNSNSNSNSSITSNVASNSNTVSNIVSNSNLVSNITSNVTSNISSNVTSNITSNVTSNITSNVTSNVTSNTTGNTVKFGGFVLQVPTEFVVSSNSTSQLQLIGSNHKDVALIDISEGDLRQLKSNTAYINSYYKSLGYTITKNATTKVYNGTEFVVIEVSKNNIPVISAYAQLTGGKILRVSLSSTDYVLNYNLLNLFATTVKTAKVSK